MFRVSLDQHSMTNCNENMGWGGWWAALQYVQYDRYIGGTFPIVFHILEAVSAGVTNCYGMEV